MLAIPFVFKELLSKRDANIATLLSNFQMFLEVYFHFSAFAKNTLYLKQKPLHAVAEGVLE